MFSWEWYPFDVKSPLLPIFFAIVGKLLLKSRRKNVSAPVPHLIRYLVIVLPCGPWILPYTRRREGVFSLELTVQTSNTVLVTGAARRKKKNMLYMNPTHFNENWYLSLSGISFSFSIFFNPIEGYIIWTKETLYII